MKTVTEHVANNTVRVSYADGSVHSFITVWNGNVLNIIWSNLESSIVSINGCHIDNLLQEESFTKDEIKRLEFILRKHLTTNK